MSRFKGSTLAAVAVVVMTMSASTGVASSTPPAPPIGDPVGTVTLFPLDGDSHQSHQMAAGPDGNMWFADHSDNSIGRVTTAGVVTTVTGSGINGPFGLAAGRDGNLWFTNINSSTNPAPGNSIGRITPAGVVTVFTDPAINGPYEIAAGPDGNMWFVNNGSNSIGRITTAGVITTFTGPGIDRPHGIAAGPDGNMWFGTGLPSVGRITPTGVITTFPDPTINRNGPYGIAAGPDGNLWFTNGHNDVAPSNSIGRITPAGVVTNFTDSTIGDPRGIAAGPDGNLWFTNFGNNSVGRITPEGVVDNFIALGIAGPLAVGAGADGNMWFANQGGGGTTLRNSIGRIVATPPEPDAACTRPCVSVGDGSMIEGDSGNRTITFPVSLSVAATAPVSVGYTLVGANANGAQKAGMNVDFNDKGGATGTVTFTPLAATGETELVKHVSVTVYGDTAAEPDETFTMTLSNPTGGSGLGRAIGIGMIINDDPGSGLRVGVADASIVEGDAGTRTVQIKVSLSQAPGTGTVSVPYTVEPLSAAWGKTAASGNDFGGPLASRTLTFTGSVVSRTITMPVYSDTAPEADETFRVILGVVTGAASVRSTGTITILNDDPAASG